MITAKYCKNCGIVFHGTTRAEFHSAACRSAYWRKKKAGLPDADVPEDIKTLLTISKVKEVSSRAIEGDALALSTLNQVDIILKQTETALQEKRRNTPTEKPKNPLFEVKPSTQIKNKRD